MDDPGVTRISVAMCTRNGEKYVSEQVESIFSQTRAVDQLVVSDDGSSDGTLDLIRDAHARRGGDVELVVLENQKPLGVTANFEQAMRACTGDLILLSDQDDVWHVDRVGVTAAAFGDPEVLAVHSDARLIDGEGKPRSGSLLDNLEVSDPVRSQLEAGDALGVYLRRNLATGATMGVSPRLLGLASPFPTDWVHDEWLAVVAALHGGLRLLPDRLIDYRQHGANQIGVAAPSIRRKIDRVLSSRGDRNVRLAARAAQLAERVDDFSISEDVRRLVREKARHERGRADLPSGRPARIPWVIGEWTRGSYGRFASQGALDVVRDLLQAP
ncbi:glycosyltransferase family 2 protein [Salinibacterium sp. ZJ77]|uniref:glycosyltransferase family 2 protein n=1 Tax=Salinibacterium sp. ZJ77 TaxID=2708337 RepID=UPI0014226014|nr:glycosyltransferase family 2 protein [Salinibacterium sp. ZJ77]